MYFNKQHDAIAGSSNSNGHRILSDSRTTRQFWFRQGTKLVLSLRDYDRHKGPPNMLKC